MYDRSICKTDRDRGTAGYDRAGGCGKAEKGDVLVVGCSSSEMVGGHIGKDSSIEAARALYAGAAPVLAEKASGWQRSAAST